MRLAETILEDKVIPVKEEDEIVQKRIVQKIMDEIKTGEEKIYGGICATCENNTTCTFLRDPSQPVMQCEEHVLVSTEKTTITVQGAAISLRSVKDGIINDASNVKNKGLCPNCKNLKTCTYSKPETGVWFCEEYE